MWTIGISIAVLTPALIFVAMIARVVWIERSSVRPPTRGALLTPLARAGVVGMTDVRIPVGAQFDLGAWYVPPKHGVVVIMAHGSGSDRSSTLPEIRLLTDAGLGILAFDWPGHGMSGGTSDWGPLARSALSAAAQWLIAQPGVDRAQIGVIGFSYGGYIVAQVAARDTAFRRVALIGTPSDGTEQTYAEYARYTRVAGWAAMKANELGGFEPDTMKARDQVAHIAPRPLLIVTGALDKTVPTAMADTIYAHAGEPKTLLRIPSAAHSDFAEVDAVGYGAALRDFFAPALRHSGSTP